MILSATPPFSSENITIWSLITTPDTVKKWTHYNAMRIMEEQEKIEEENKNIKHTKQK